MENIVGLIDMDGFWIQKRFLCKELGLLKVGDDTASSFFFDIAVRWSDLDEKDTRCCKYLIRKSINFRWEYLVAHRLTLWRHWKSWSLIFTKAYKRDGKSTLAYKGGILERVSSLRQSRSGGLRTLVNKSGSLMKRKRKKNKTNNKKKRFF